MSDDLNRQIFREEAYDLLGELEGALLELEENPDDMDLINQIFRALHTIKGSGSMFGFEDIAEFTHEVETVFDIVRNGELKVSPALCGLGLKSRDYIKSMLDGEAAADSPVRDEILDGLKDISGMGDAEEPGLVESSEVLVSPDDIEEGGESSDSVRYKIRMIPRPGSDVDESMLKSVFDELETLGEFSIVSRPQDSDGTHPLGGEWELSLDTAVGVDDVNDVFLFVDADLAIEISEFNESLSSSLNGEAEGVTTSPEQIVPTSPLAPPKTLQPTGAGTPLETPPPKLGELLIDSGELTERDVQEALQKQKPLGQILAEDGKIEPDKVEKAVQKQIEVKEREANKKRQEAMSSIRVAADKLDFLVDLVGELVIVQAQISQVVSERNDPQMTALAEELERLSDELRDSTLGIRMLPIGTSFSKFKRLVRDLSGELGKEIGLSTSGEDTELDKTVIERLGDPMVHLLRNSLDHGIETPEERQAQGKPSQGMILLSAEHSGGEVLIRITDDGRGMSTEAIREKAIERGLILRDTELTEKELLKLIFEPGFSTAKEVTNVSGRGVGMDVVKRAIDSLRGTIDIDSKPGQGTTITIRLPLTLAIIDGLQVRVENEYYVIPLSLVEECVELSRSEVEASDSAQRILHLRGEIVPYIHIRDWFDIEGDNPPIEQIVITGVEGSRVGIVVDTVIGEHQTVIKSLSRVYKDVEGISGATIKGDGSIALILDIPSLVRRVVAESK